MKQYNPKKPHKWGLCMWSVADAKSGYTYGWQIFAGKGHHILDSGKGVTYDSVTKKTPVSYPFLVDHLLLVALSIEGKVNQLMVIRR